MKKISGIYLINYPLSDNDIVVYTKQNVLYGKRDFVLLIDAK